MEYYVGQIVEGEITGIQPYGAFVKLDDEKCGLVHISEISKDYIKDIHNLLSIHQKIKVKIIEMDENSEHFKLSIKALKNGKREKRKYYKGAKLPKMDIGFQTLEDHLDAWIEEADV